MFKVKNMANIRDLDKRSKRLEEHVLPKIEVSARKFARSESSASLAWQTSLEKKRWEYIFSKNSNFKPAYLSDVRGMPHIVADIQRFITFLRNYQKFKEKGVRIQPGILLYGKPGTGKTLTARVIATESGAKLIDGGGFPKERRGWTAGDITALFALAREYHTQTKKPVILYFDEISGICYDGATDGIGFDGTPDEMYFPERRRSTEAAVALTSELDGLSGKPEGIFVIAATNVNRCHIDESLLRAGRLGHHIHYTPPATSGRADILRYYLERKSADKIDAENLAKVMGGCVTPAEIEELVEQAYMEACLDSANLGEFKLTNEYLVKQLLKDVLGSPTGTWCNESVRYRACVHEAGHVIAGAELRCPARLVVVPKNGYTRGVTLFDFQEDGPSTSKSVENQIVIGYGGGAAEELIFGERTLEGRGDVGKATELSIKLVGNWGKTTNYFDGNPIRYSGGGKLLQPLSDSERSSVYAKAQRVRTRCYKHAKNILENVKEKKIAHMAKLIFEREFLLGNDLEHAMLEVKKGLKRRA